MCFTCAAIGTFVRKAAKCFVPNVVTNGTRRRPKDRDRLSWALSFLSDTTLASHLAAFKEIVVMLRELVEAHLELARRDRTEAFARAPSPMVQWDYLSRGPWP
jgi:hypothetical protein